MSMSRWRLSGNELEERTDDWSATFTMMNVDTGEIVKVGLTQNRGGPADDLVGALRATTALIVQAMAPGADEPGTSLEQMN
jgi:hypothetical protein